LRYGLGGGSRLANGPGTLHGQAVPGRGG